MKESSEYRFSNPILSAPQSETRVIRGEPVLWERAGEGARARTLFAPGRILRVHSANQLTEYPPGEVVVTGGREVETRLPVPAFSEGDLYPAEEGPFTIPRHRDGLRFLHFSEGHYFHDRQVCLDYETEESWSGPLPPPQAARLPRLAAFLSGGGTLEFAVLGDSISTGANASGRSGVPPNQPGYTDLLADLLRQKSGGEVRLTNLSVGGKDARWGVSRIPELAEIRPDLLVVAFGMNDASDGVSPEEFGKAIQTILRGVRSASPHTEFAVISGMTPNSEWHLDNPHLREEHHENLARIASETGSTAFVDIRSVWRHAVARKGFWSLTGNGVNHPNDFGHRLYAECVWAAIET